MTWLSKIWKAVLWVGGLVGVAAQAKARGASTAETIAETAAAAASGVGALHMAAPTYGKAADAPKS